MNPTYVLLAFDDMEELDFVGPWEVFGMARMREGGDGDRVICVAERSAPVRCSKGLRIVPDCDFASAPPADVLLVPGGLGTRAQTDNPVLLEFIRKSAASARWVASVCTGAALLHAAGLTSGRRITTHWAYVPELRERAPDSEVVDGVRYVRDGNLVTSAGVSAGTDMALWLVGQLHGIEHARRTQRLMQYDPAPPYAADV